MNGSVIPSYDFLKFLLVYCLWLWTFRLNQPGVTWSPQLILSIWPQMLHCTSLPWLFCLPVVLLTRYLNFLLCSTGLPSERSCFWHAFTFSYVAQIASFPTKNQSLNTPVCIENHFISRWVQFSWKVKTNVKKRNNNNNNNNKWTESVELTFNGFDLLISIGGRLSGALNLIAGSITSRKRRWTHW